MSAFRDAEKQMRSFMAREFPDEEFKHETDGKNFWIIWRCGGRFVCIAFAGDKQARWGARSISEINTGKIDITSVAPKPLRTAIQEIKRCSTLALKVSHQSEA